MSTIEAVAKTTVEGEANSFKALPTTQQLREEFEEGNETFAEFQEDIEEDIALTAESHAAAAEEENWEEGEGTRQAGVIFHNMLHTFDVDRNSNDWARLKDLIGINAQIEAMLNGWIDVEHKLSAESLHEKVRSKLDERANLMGDMRAAQDQAEKLRLEGVLELSRQFDAADQLEESVAELQTQRWLH